MALSKEDKKRQRGFIYRAYQKNFSQFNLNNL
jgi:hypothetical protein